MIDDYLQEPNSIAEDWYKVMKLCRQALREMVKE
jgi:ribosomal protein S14